MEKLGDDEIGLVLSRVFDLNDRKSCALVCKQWLRVEGLTRSSLRVLEPKLLHKFLPRFPNLATFGAGRGITDTDLEFVAQTCPNLRVLNLNLRQTKRVLEEFDALGLDDVGDDGISAVATGCRSLAKVCLRRRRGIGNVGVITLIKSSQNLTALDLTKCEKVTDQALEAIGAATSLQVLNLQGCSLVTDWGLASLATGSSSRTLKKLVLAECDQITDVGVSLLQQMYQLEELNLAECGPKVTDVGGVAIAAIHTLERLDFSWLINISDVTLVAVAQNCCNLVEMDVTGCELITGAGIRAFSNHETLEVLVLASCYNVFGDDVEQTVVECQSLKYVGLDKGLRMWMPTVMQDNIRRFCILAWR
ncbi:PREDICTED: F-box/LRR-repeat protein 20-like [Nelumbo nucifera]|uniref:F-box/LRR-repeat protein 20-like n=1 Tax=Nelumbo nucifera TaxID=4432 RepID=A0A1U7ZQ32_NELNU|nr:PREDICTED: F-box/LRR-repeat protein 20-like [Nelumbo nucifera]